MNESGEKEPAKSNGNNPELNRDDGRLRMTWAASIS
jgi:hypothetical protein